MPLNALVAVDESGDAMKITAFVVKMFSHDCNITLLSIVQPLDLLCEMDFPALKGYMAAHHSDYCRNVDEQREAALKSSLNDMRRRLIDAGFSENNISVLLKPMKVDVALEILEESHTGYDVIVMGRRRLSTIKGFFLGSVSQKVVSASKDISVLIVN